MVGVCQEGDIIYIKYKNNETVVHRLKADYNAQGYLITQGDNNNEQERVNLDEVEEIRVVGGVLFT